MAGTQQNRGDPPGGDAAVAAVHAAVATVFREEAGRLAASVTRVLGDFDAAEEVVQDALLAAWRQWPVEGVPDRPGAWLWTVARRRAVDLLRREIRLREKLATPAW
ncbi:MAG: sigma factor, partial [Streptosporangiaceae bacterium]